MATTTHEPASATNEKHSPADHHHRAAAHHSAAAHHHLEAAHHHEMNEHAPAKQHAEAAHRHGEQAHKQTTNARPFEQVNRSRRGSAGREARGLRAKLVFARIGKETPRIAAMTFQENLDVNFHRRTAPLDDALAPSQTGRPPLTANVFLGEETRVVWCVGPNPHPKTPRPIPRRWGVGAASPI